MATTESSQITITSSGDGITSEYKPTAMSNANGPAGGPVRLSLASGDNTITVPTGAMGMVLVPPSTSGVTKRFKHHSGETGMAMRTDQPMLFPLPTGTSSVLLNASDIEVIRIHWV